MAHWTNEPTFHDDTPSYQLLRCQPATTLRATILSDHVAGTQIHYWKGRTTPCNQTACDACKAGHRPRWKAYLYIISRKTQRIAIIEFTERCMQEVALYLQTHNTLRGANLTLSRTGNRPNSPLHLELSEPTCDPTKLPTPDGLTEVLDRMWELHTPTHRQTTLSIAENIPIATTTNGRLAK